MQHRSERFVDEERGLSTTSVEKTTHAASLAHRGHRHGAASVQRAHVHGRTIGGGGHHRTRPGHHAPRVGTYAAQHTSHLLTYQQVQQRARPAEARPSRGDHPEAGLSTGLSRYMLSTSYIVDFHLQRSQSVSHEKALQFDLIESTIV